MLDRAKNDLPAGLGMAVEQASDSIFVTDPAGTIVYVNPAFERATGWSRDEAVGRTPALLRSDRQPPEFYAGIWRALVAGETWSGRLVSRRKDGTLIEEDTTITPLADESGRTVNIVAVNRDVTRERRIEERLRHSQKMEAIGQLAGGIAHDFNNLLMAMLAAAELLDGKLEPDHPARPELEAIRRTGDRAAQLTRRVLSFARRGVLDRGDFDVAQLLEEMLPIVERLLPRGVHLVHDVGDGPWMVHGDREQLSQVVLNLCLNARDAMPGGGTVTVRLDRTEVDDSWRARRPWAVPGRYVRLVVEDTGGGIPGNVLAQVFEPFFTTKPRGQGTGLGLAICYGIVKQHRGIIDLASEPGRGTRASVLLPELPAPGPAQAAPGTAPGAEPLAGNETILAVEDEPEVRRILVEVLTGYGYNAVSAATGAAALDLLERMQPPPDLVLSDIVMPGMGGRELFHAARAAGCRAPFLFSSGYPEDVVDRHVAEPDAHFIAKPYRVQALLRKVREVLDTRAR